MADQKVNIKVTAQGAKKAGKDIGGLDGSIKKLGRSVLNASVAYFGTSGLINGIMKSAELAGIQEQAEKKLEFALGRTSQALLDQASALQKTTRFGDEATIAQMGFLASIGFTEEKIQQVIPVAMDLAEATGMSLESAVRNTAKTFSGMAGELGELVPQIRGLTSEQMKAGEAVKVMGELFGGQAQAQAQTYAGSIEQLKNDLGDMAEGIGEIVIPIFEDLAPHIKRTIDFWKGYISQTKEATESDKEVSESMALLNEQIDLQRDRLELFTEASKDNNEIQQFAIANGVTFFEQKARALSTMDNERTKLRELIEEQLRLAKAEDDALLKSKESIEVNKDVVKSLDTIKNANKENTEQTKLAKMAEEERFQTSLSGIRSMIKGSLAQAIAGAVAKEVGSKGLAGLVTGTAVAVGVTSLFDQYVPKFADGGIVQGNPSKGDVVPVMATAGELILNQAQQENLVNSGITINISAPLVDETVVDSIIPAIERARRLGIA